MIASKMLYFIYFDLGKSLFLYYILVRRLALKKPTIWQLSSEKYIFFNSEGYTVSKGDIKIRETKNKPIWALSDSNEYMTIPHNEFLTKCGESLIVVQAASPKEKRYKEWIKQRRGTLYCMKSWCWFEIELLHHFVNKNQSIVFMREMYEKYSSSARSFQWTLTKESFKDGDIEVCKAMSMMETLVGFPSLESNDKYIADKSSKLFLLEPEDDSNRNRFVTLIATKYIEHCIYEHMERISLEKRKVLFNNLQSIPNSKSLSGHMFEFFVHKQLYQKENTFDLMDLNCENILFNFKPRGLIKEFSRLEELSVKTIFDRYLVPCLRNFATIDSLAIIDNVVHLFQCTVSNQHTRKNKGFDRIADTLKNLKLDFLLPWKKGVAKWRLVAVIPEKISHFKFNVDNTGSILNWGDEKIVECVLVLPFDNLNKYRQLENSSGLCSDINIASNLNLKRRLSESE